MVTWLSKSSAVLHIAREDSASMCSKTPAPLSRDIVNVSGLRWLLGPARAIRFFSTLTDGHSATLHYCLARTASVGVVRCIWRITDFVMWATLNER